MSQVETVALWAGLIASIAGIVLSIAALIFGFWVNNRATEVNDQTIRSLQKIESAVERLSEDTRSLIKAGWDKMLGNFGAASETFGAEEEEEDKQEIASGLAQEARAELAETTPGRGSNVSPELVERIEQVLHNFEQAIAGQLENTGRGGPQSRSVDRLLTRVSALSPEAQALLAELVRSGHLDLKQYRALAKDSRMGAAVRELRRKGLLVPLSGLDGAGGEIPVYWLPSRIAGKTKAAISLLPEIGREVRTAVRDDLQKLGYAAAI